MSSITWYTYKPIDTILVRGAEDDSSSNITIFPPPAQTIAGAVRTAYLKERNICISDYIAKEADKVIYEMIGEPSAPPPFTIMGPLFEKDKEIFIPVPVTWFYQRNNKNDKDECRDKNNKVKHIPIKDIVPAKIINKKDLEDKKIYSSKPIKVWPEKLENSIDTLSGYFINIKDLNLKQDKEKITFYNADFFYCKEERVGVALYDYRSTREGKLYGFSHFRLNNQVRLLFGLTQDNILSDKGYLKIGAEQRFGLYELFNNEQLNKKYEAKNGVSYLALSYIPCSPENQQKVLAFDRIAYFGGWDMAKGFHKPMQAYYPPGSVFAEYIENTIAIQEEKNA